MAGRPLEPGKSYVTAITDFMASGGDGYEVFKNKPATRTGSPLRELIVDAVRQRGKLAARTDGRILREDQDTRTGSPRDPGPAK